MTGKVTEVTEAKEKKTVKEVKRQKKFKIIATHQGVHLDELVAICLLKKFGEEKFPGIRKAKVVYWNTGGKTPDGRSVEDYEKEGVLIVGMCGSKFDEHPSRGDQIRKGECATTLVAKYLGVEDDPALEKIFNYVIRDDTKGGSHPFDLSHIIKLLHQKYPDNPTKVVRWAIEAIEAKYEEQLQFFTVTKQEFERKAKIEDIFGPNGRQLKLITIVTIVSDDPQMNKFARSAHGCNADIVIQKNSLGNVQIFTNKKSSLLLYDVAQMIRLKEQYAKHKVVTTDWQKLASEGNVEGVEEWFFHYEGQMLLNGSLTASAVPPTRLTLDTIRALVKIGVDTNYFNDRRSNDCKEGICTSTRNSECSLYKFGLHRCRKIRFEMKKNQ
jgi:hypothetical protein